MLATYRRLAVPEALVLSSGVADGHLIGHRAVLEGALWTASGLDTPAVRLLSAYTYLSVLGTAAVRLGLYGAIALQSAISELNPLMAALATAPLPDETMPTSFNPVADVALLRAPSRHHALFGN
jgi:urease accessory protein